MSADPASIDIQRWIEVFHRPGKELVYEITSKWPDNKKILVDGLAEDIYNDIRRNRQFFISPFPLNEDFNKLTDNDKSPWYEFASEIPVKLRMLKLFIRPYKGFCRTCLIPYSDMEVLARADYRRICRKAGNDHQNKFMPFSQLPDEEKRFYIELNHLIPVGLKKAGYELVREEEVSEISEKLVTKFAKAIHSRYINQIRKEGNRSRKSLFPLWRYGAGGKEKKIAENFDDLPEEIKHSNLDNAYQIPAKLLAIGYKLRQTGKAFRPAVIRLTEDEIETMARLEHIRWCWDKILHGWIYGKDRDDKKKTHPSIMAYEDLSEPEKEKDRELVRMIPALIRDVDYDVIHVSPEKIRKIPYAIKPQSSISRILADTRDLNNQIRKKVKLNPNVEQMVEVRNKKIETALKEIEASYNYALHIQEKFLPDNLYIRECFPDSFILFKPKDIVSGDFYFFSKSNKNIFFAAADCTGHGIPGALLSTIGYGILDEAVNTVHLLNPSDILKHLYLKIHKFLKTEQESPEVSDDMDIALCRLDIKELTLAYAGIGIPLYVVSDGRLTEFRPGNIRRRPDEINNGEYSSEAIGLKQGDAIYLMSDGYHDQFGGQYHKRYQTVRLKNYLLKIKDRPMPEQGDMLYEEIEKWRGEKDEEQTDDILVIGVRI